jgi:hypothetical protein
MKQKIILWFALFLGGNLAFCGPSRLQLSGIWSNVTVKLIVPGSSNPAVKCTIEEIPGKWAVYEVIPKPPLPYWSKFSILAVYNPRTKMNSIMDANHTFYTFSKAGMMGYTVHAGGVRWSPSYLEMPEADGNLAAAIAKFEKEFDGQKLNNGLLEQKTNHVGFQRASPLFYALEAPVGGAKPAEMKIEALEITDDILRVDVRNAATHKPASYWIDPAQKKIIKSVVDGHRMNLDTGEPWAEPMD